MKDVIIIGAGPAGMSAALYSVMGGASVKIVESSMYGGQMASGAVIENYPGVGRITGWELSERMHSQLDSSGIDITYGTADGIRRIPGGFAVSISGEESRSRTVIISCGVRRRRLSCPGEAELLGRGVSYCAVCDGNFHRGGDVAVIGGGRSAVGEALYLSGICRWVYLIHRGGSLRDGDAAMSAVTERGNISLCLESTVEKICGDGAVESIKIVGPDGKSEPNVSGVFISIGSEPQNAAFRDIVELTDDGYIRTFGGGRTSERGIFAAGDARDCELRQIVTAAADGAVAATGVIDYIRGSRQET